MTYGISRAGIVPMHNRIMVTEDVELLVSVILCDGN
jgi:hypothetical protein